MTRDELMFSLRLWKSSPEELYNKSLPELPEDSLIELPIVLTTVG